MRRNCLALVLSGVVIGLATGRGRATDQVSVAEQVRFFETNVRPVLAERCYQCHGPTKQKADLRLDRREGILKGGESGPAVVPGHPEKSLLIRAIRHENGVAKM